MRRVNSVPSALNTGQIRLDCGDGLIAEVGDTGKRRLTFPEQAKGSFDIQRSGNMVTILVLRFGFNPGVENGINLSNAIPVGFRPSSILNVKPVKFWSSDTEEALRVTNTGNVYFLSSNDTTSVSWTLTYPTLDPWPTTLPGTAV